MAMLQLFVTLEECGRIYFYHLPKYLYVTHAYVDELSRVPEQSDRLYSGNFTHILFQCL